MMSESERLLVQRLNARVTETELWLALLAAKFGASADPDEGTGYTLSITFEEAEFLRQQLDWNFKPTVNIDFDTATATYRIDAL